MSEKKKAVTRKKMFQILGCSDVTFYNRYKDKVEQFPTTGVKNLYSYDDIMKLKEELNLPEPQSELYDIIE
jgi:hypothetical protein